MSTTELGSDAWRYLGHSAVLTGYGYRTTGAPNTADTMGAAVAGHNRNGCDLCDSASLPFFVCPHRVGNYEALLVCPAIPRRALKRSGVA